MNKKIHKNLGKRILDWSKEYGKHFCIHDLIGFFSEIPMGNLSGCVSALTRQGKLIQASSKETCRMSSREHLFWIYSNKIVKPTETKIEPKPQKLVYRRWTEEERNKIKQMLEEGKKTKDIAKFYNVSKHAVSSLLSRHPIEYKKKRVQKAVCKEKKRRIVELTTCPLCEQPCKLIIIKD